MKKKILIVDDTKEIRHILKSSLEYEGYEVIQACNGKEAIDILLALEEKLLPHLIMLDLMMPVMGGIEFMEEVQKKHIEKLASIPIIVMTAQTDPTFTSKGPMAVLRKPRDLDTMFAVIEKCISSR